MEVRVLHHVMMKLFRAFQEILWPFGLIEEAKRSFWVLASFWLSYRPLRACSFAKASPKPKNPRSDRPHYFLKRSGHKWPGYCQQATVFLKLLQWLIPPSSPSRQICAIRRQITSSAAGNTWFRPARRR
jgi:hypothetical protein